MSEAIIATQALDMEDLIKIARAEQRKMGLRPARPQETVESGVGPYMPGFGGITRAYALWEEAQKHADQLKADLAQAMEEGYGDFERFRTTLETIAAQIAGAKGEAGVRSGGGGKGRKGQGPGDEASPAAAPGDPEGGAGRPGRRRRGDHGAGGDHSDGDAHGRALDTSDMGDHDVARDQQIIALEE